MSLMPCRAREPDKQSGAPELEKSNLGKAQQDRMLKPHLGPKSWPQPGGTLPTAQPGTHPRPLPASGSEGAKTRAKLKKGGKTEICCVKRKFQPL